MAKSSAKKQNNDDANLGFEAQLWATADKLRGNMEPSDYKHVALGLIFLKYISDAFEAKRAELLQEELADAEDPEEYLAENVFWVPKEARWSHLQAKGEAAHDRQGHRRRHAGDRGEQRLAQGRPAQGPRPSRAQQGHARRVDRPCERDRHGREGRPLPRHPRPRVRILSSPASPGRRASAGGEFYTPRSVVRLLVEMLEPYKGRVYDPCCGSGGMFVQSEKFVEEHGGRIGDIAIYGQESNYTTWRLAKMNLAVRGIDADIRWNNEGSFHKDELQDLKADFILANPPFNISDWGGDRPA